MSLKLQVTLVAFCLLLAVPSFVNIIPVCNAQFYGSQIPNLEISYDMYNWTTDMNRLSMTTPETGLVFRITILNNDSKPLAVGYSNYNSYLYNSNSVDSLTIIIEMSSSDTTILSQPTKTIKFASDNQLYLPPNTDESFFVEFNQNGNSLPIGSYTAKVSYYLNSAPNYGYNGVLIGNTPIGQYPFNFQVENQRTLDNAISQNPNRVSQGFNLTFTSIALIILISVILAVVLSVVLIYFIIPRTRFKEKFRDQTKKKYQFGGLTTALTIIFSLVQIYLAYLQLIKA